MACCKLSFNAGSCIAVVGVPGLAISGFQRSACRSERTLYACHTTINHNACNRTDWLIEPTAFCEQLPLEPRPGVLRCARACRGDETGIRISMNHTETLNNESRRQTTYLNHFRLETVILFNGISYQFVRMTAFSEMHD